MNNRYMRQMNDYLEGGQGSAPRQNGAFANMVPRQTMIRDQPHMLAYINPTEEQMLRDMGGSGMPGPDGVPAYDHNWLHSGAQKVGGAISNTFGDQGYVEKFVDKNIYDFDDDQSNEITTSYLDQNDVAHSTRADADAADAVINTTATTSAALPIDYQTTPAGSVFFVDEFGVNQYVGGGNWGQRNPSQALTDYLGSEDHLGALTDTGPVATSLTTNPNVTSFKGLVDDGFGGKIYGTQDLDGRITYYPNGDADGDGRMSDEEKTAAAQSGFGFPTLKDATDYLGYSGDDTALIDYANRDIDSSNLITKTENGDLTAGAFAGVDPANYTEDMASKVEDLSTTEKVTIYKDGEPSEVYASLVPDFQAMGWSITPPERTNTTVITDGSGLMNQLAADTALTNVGTDAAGTYVIKSEDTLSAIAFANGVTVADLMAANPKIENKNEIFTGESIIIPTGTGADTTEVANTNADTTLNVLELSMLSTKTQAEAEAEARAAGQEMYAFKGNFLPVTVDTTGADAGALTNVGTDIPTFANYYEAIDAGWLGKEVIINGQNVIAETADGYTGTGEVTTGTDADTTEVANTDARAEAGLDPIATASVNLETGQIEGSTLNLTDAEINQLNQEKQAWDNNSYFEGDASTKGFYETIFGTKFQDTFAGGLIGVTEDGLFGSEGAADKLYLSGVDFIDGGGQGLAGVEFGAGDNTALDLNKNGYLDADEMARGRDFYKNNLISNYSNAIDASTYNEDAGLFGTGGLYDVLSDFTDPLTIAGNIATDGVGVGQAILNKTGLDEMLAGTVTGNLLGIDENATGFEAVNVDPEFINTVVAKVLAEDPLSGYNLVTDENGVTTFTGPDGEKIDLSQITNNENITNEYTTNVTNVTNEAASLPIETKILTEERPIDQVFERLKRYNSGYLPAYMQKWLTDNSIDELVRKIVGEDGETYYITPDGRYLTADQFENTINVGSKSFATGSETVETGYTVLDTNTGILETYDTEDNLISTVGGDTSETEEAA
jgi:LysM repeat protein